MVLGSIFFGSLIFNSFAFLIFFPIIILFYFILPHKVRWFLLLVASIYFYMSFIPIYILILGFTIVIDYFAGIIIEKSKGKKRRIFLIISLLANIGVLAVFKYYNFINENLTFLLNPLGIHNNLPYLSILLPIGLSFHTFQAMSYTIEVYRSNQKAERHFGIYALYVLFFPQLVAGPIERPQNLLPQFKKKQFFNRALLHSGLALMLWGFFKKVVIADRLAILVDTVYGNVDNYTGFPLVLATVFFAFQIYCDFSGYTDIAIGAAQVMGIKLMDNFKRPYFSRSIGEFWKRWHISLSTWFRDYLYIPLGGNRVSVPRWYFNLFFVFLISGLWHGANWTFVIWGALHGIYLIIGLVTSPYRDKIKNKIRMPNRLNILIQVVLTFIFTSIAWIFFRADNVSDAWYIITNLFTNFSFKLSGTNLGLDTADIIIAFASILLMEFVHIIQEHKGMRHFLSDKPKWLRWAIYVTLILFILLFGVFKNKEFIYFQF